MENKIGKVMTSAPKSFFKKFLINTKNSPQIVAKQLRKILEECELSASEREFAHFLLTETNLAH